MAKIQQAKVIPSQKSTPSLPSTGKFTLKGPDSLITLICVLYFAVHAIPELGAIDVMGPGWLYLTIIDILVTAYIIARKKSYEPAAAAVCKNIFSILYIAFLLLAGISIFTAINPTESWVCYSRLIATVVAFFNMAIILQDRIINVFKILAQIMSLTLLFSSLYTLNIFFKGVNDVPLTDLILSMKGNTGNKNVFAASLATKVPFVLFCIYTFKNWGRLLNLIILFTSILAVLVINSRSAYLGLVLMVVLYLLLAGLQYSKERHTERLLYRLAYIFIPLLAAFLVSQIVLSDAASQPVNQEGSYYGTVGERFTSMSASNATSKVRLLLWEQAMSYIKDNPFKGCGYGNWKIACIPYDKIYHNDLNVPAHSHNDFLEVTTELGIHGGLLYIGLFVCLAIYGVKVWLSEASNELKVISAFSLMAIASYFVDAVFNFPNERPVMQMFFAFAAALNICAFNTARKKETTEPRKETHFKPAFALGAFLFLLPATYVNYLAFKSMKAQLIILPDLGNEQLTLKSDYVVSIFPPIPNLTATGQQIDGIIGRYFYQEKKFDQALIYLTKASKTNPPIMYAEFLKADVYYEMNKLDSAYYWGKMAFYNKPRAKTYYQTYVAICSKMKDTASITKAFREFVYYRPEPFAWDMYLRGMLHATGGGTKQLAAMADSAILLFEKNPQFQKDPALPELYKRKQEILSNTFVIANAAGSVQQAELLAKIRQYEATGTAAFNKQDYKTAALSFAKAAELNPGNLAFSENAAISYFNMKAYKTSIPYFDRVIKFGTGNGKAEFFKGVALINIGSPKDEACSLLKIAKAKGYPDPNLENLLATYCK